MRVALVDDNKNDLAFLHEYISEQTAHSCQIDTFSSGESFLSCWQMGAYDLVVLDIFMGKMTGIEVAEKASWNRQKRPYRIRHFKQRVCKRKLRPQRLLLSLQALSGWQSKSHAWPDRFWWNWSYVPSVKLPDGQNVILRNVIYIDCASHIVTIHCTDGESIVSRNSFAEIESIFCSHSYFYTSTKGVIVNFYEIAQQKSDLFIMSDGTHIPISRRKSRETLDAFAQFRFSDLRKGGEQ